MSLETLLLWVVIGLIAGWLASAVVGGGFGLIGDIVVGVVGAFVGGLIFNALDIGTPFGGIAARSSSPSSERSCCCSRYA